MGIEISDREFARFQGFMLEEAGIALGPSKKALVSGRLEKRLRHHHFHSYGDYLGLLASRRDPDEVQLAIDLLTTNETYFFREPQHFELLRDEAAAARRAGRPLRVWSAACSTGEEAYSIAMVLADRQAELGWQLLASDISAKVLRRACFGHYPESRTVQMPPAYRRRFCLKGVGEQAGTLLVQRSLRERIEFAQINLDRPLPSLGSFDLIFLRNVMIYFGAETKRRVVARLLPVLKPGGLLLVGHSETLNGVCDALTAVRPSVYRRG
jgi:chemotaxis protein methyltransferase CheR